MFSWAIWRSNHGRDKIGKYLLPFDDGEATGLYILSCALCKIGLLVLGVGSGFGRPGAGLGAELSYCPVVFGGTLGVHSFPDSSL